MPDLVSAPELLAFLGNPEGADSTLLESILDGVEDSFEAACNRRERPFQAAPDEARLEVRDGTGTPSLFLDYPITTLTSVTLGRNVADPDETLDIADVDVLVYETGKRRIIRTDGGTFGCLGSPRYVRVTYLPAADLPYLAALAVKRAAAAIYRQLGAEDSTSERLGTFSRELLDVFGDGDSMWRAAVNAHWEPRV